MQDQSNLSQADVELIEIASAHAKKRFQKDFISIAAALRTKSGKIYTGINLKYRVRNVCTCGEIMAMYSALNDGDVELDTIVGVKYIEETDTFMVVNGCGLCRQLMNYNLPLDVIIDNNGRLEKVSAKDLLPHAFL